MSVGSVEGANDPANYRMDLRAHVFRVAEENGISNTEGSEYDHYKLIKLVRKFPSLYNPKNRVYKYNKECQDYIWEAIAEVLGLNKSDAITKWKSLKGTFRKYQYNLRGGTSNDGSAYDDNILNALTFLEDFPVEQEDAGSDSGRAFLRLQYDTESEDDDETFETDYFYRLTDSSFSEMSPEEQFNSLISSNSPDVLKFLLSSDDIVFAQYVAYKVSQIECPIRRREIKEEIFNILYQALAEE
ncbi:uncharacterized protein LOC115886378 [Sitophilus oryzae]|uniref:Uncharacterized protein LOC115886378 n=1 Tax=Sitophilus oryzae TaxID=7048 RepID=A0A6J2YDA8_SITOR|nr:uncharacterized protein LOC115886378 [Sitophilus oryzae]